jgi:FmdE, Molybdenum formylmethanofuran dehydrogenase operon
MKNLCQAAILAAVALCAMMPVTRAETPEQWIALGTRVHGFFGGFIPAGIRIGLDAVSRLKAPPRQLSVVYFSGDGAPCPCIVDGIMLAIRASPGQGTAAVSTVKAPRGLMGMAIIIDRKTGAALRYTIAADWTAKMLGWNKLDPVARWNAAMNANGLFKVAPVAQP